MTIEELQQQKRTLETTLHQYIAALLDDFVLRTGISVESIHFSILDATAAGSGRGGVLVSPISVRLKL